MTENVLRELKRCVKGKVLFKEPLAFHTSFGIGGPADIWVVPQDTKGLKDAVGLARKHKMPLLLIGSGSNILAKDEGFKGMVVHLGAPFFKRIDIEGGCVRVGAGCSMSRLVRLCCAKGLGGLESLVGIPGTVGGAVRINAGGSTNPIYKNIGDFVTTLKVMDYRGNLSRLGKDDVKFGYRSSSVGHYIILEVALKLKRDNSSALNSRYAQFLNMKRQKQTLDMPSAGCVFKNPEGSQLTCGQMIDMLGLKGTSIGGARISDRHANFIVNRGAASSGDVLKLIEFIREKVSKNYNIDLELEIEIV